MALLIESSIAKGVACAFFLLLISVSAAIVLLAYRVEIVWLRAPGGQWAGWVGSGAQNFTKGNITIVFN